MRGYDAALRRNNVGSEEWGRVVITKQPRQIGESLDLRCISHRELIHK